MEIKKFNYLPVAIGFIFGYVVLSGAYNMGKWCFMRDKAETAQAQRPATK